MPLAIESFDERLAGRYPRAIGVSDGQTLTLAPLVPSDWECLTRFLADIPAHERRFFRHDLSDAVQVEQWCAQLDYRTALPLLAWDGDRIAADAVLLLDPGMWTGHLGKLRLLVHPWYRSRGVGSALVAEMVEIAKLIGLHKLVHECAAPQVDLIDLLKQSDFVEVARLPEFVRDRDGRVHDLVVLVH